MSTMLSKCVYSYSIYIISYTRMLDEIVCQHFFVWNPPLLDSAGNDIGAIIAPLQKKNTSSKLIKWKHKRQNWSSSGKAGTIKRSHAADESARLLAHAVKNGIRCIVFCKTRMLGE